MISLHPAAFRDMSCLLCVVLLWIPVYYILRLVYPGHQNSRYVWELLRVRGLEKKAVVVTGTDSGFGRLLVLKLARHGIPVYAGCLTKEVCRTAIYAGQGVESLKREEEFSTGKLRPLQLDVTNDGSVAAAVKHVKGDMKEGEGLCVSHKKR